MSQDYRFRDIAKHMERVTVSTSCEMGDQASYLSAYPGPAFVVQYGGERLYSNDQGQVLWSALKGQSAQDMDALIREAAHSTCVVTGKISVITTQGEHAFDVTVVPSQPNGSDESRKPLLTILAHDLTMERNLRTALAESRQRYKDLVEISSDFSWEVGSDGVFVFVTPQGALGYSADDLVGKNPGDFLTGGSELKPNNPFRPNKPIDHVTVWMRRTDGGAACVQVTAVPLIDDEGHWRGARGVCRDITEEHAQEQALNAARQRERLLHSIVSTIRDEVDPTNMLTAAATATARALGAAGSIVYRRDPDLGFVVSATFGDQNDDLERSQLVEELAGLGPGQTLEKVIGEFCVLGAATHYRQATNGAICIWQRDHQPWNSDYHVLIGDVANQLGIANEQITKHQHILTLSRTDGMTGLLNRRAFFDEELPRRLKRLDRDSLGAALVYVDMDNFKRVNDVHGHQIGDKAIMMLRDLLQESSRPGDVVARLGGDEFAIWLDAIPIEAVSTRVDNLIAKSRVLKQYSGDDAYPLGISIGVAIYEPGSHESLDSLLLRADQAMYRVKHSCKGGFAIADHQG